MAKANTIVRYILGVFCVIFGLNGFLQFIPMPPPEGMAAQFMGAFFGSGWGVVIKVLEIVGGVSLLANRYVRLTLVILAAISLNAICFHLFMAPGAIGGAALFFVLTAFLIYANFDWYKDLLKATD